MYKLSDWFLSTPLRRFLFVVGIAGGVLGLISSVRFLVDPSSSCLTTCNELELWLLAIGSLLLGASTVAGLVGLVVLGVLGVFGIRNLIGWIKKG